MMQQTNLKDEYVMAAEWDKATALQVNLKFKYFNMVQIKLRQLGVPNLIVDNSNSDAN